MYVRGNPVRLHDPSGNAGGMVLDEVEVKALPETPTLGEKRGQASGSFEEMTDDSQAVTDSTESTGDASKTALDLKIDPVYLEWDEIDWPSFISSVKNDKSTRITLDESGTKVANIETVDDALSTTEIYSFTGDLQYRLSEAKVQNYYNDPQERVKTITRAPFLGDITPQARQYFETFQKNMPVFDLLKSGTNAKFDFKGTEWINENPNSVVILAGYAMTLRDAGNFIFGYSARAKGYPASFVAWGGGFDEQNKGMWNKLKGLAEYSIIVPEFKYQPPYFGEAPRSANMAYLGMSLFAGQK
jgi:hypothetical protein